MHSDTAQHDPNISDRSFKFLLDLKTKREASSKNLKLKKQDFVFWMEGRKGDYPNIGRNL